MILTGKTIDAAARRAIRAVLGARARPKKRAGPRRKAPKRRR